MPEKVFGARNEDPYVNGVMLYFRFWLCTFTLTVSLGAVLLLPMSILSNEIMIMYPEQLLHQVAEWLTNSWYLSEISCNNVNKADLDTILLYDQHYVRNNPVILIIFYF